MYCGLPLCIRLARLAKCSRTSTPTIRSTHACQSSKSTTSTGYAVPSPATLSTARNSIPASQRMWQTQLPKRQAAPATSTFISRRISRRSVLRKYSGRLTKAAPIIECNHRWSLRFQCFAFDRYENLQRSPIGNGAIPSLKDRVVVVRSLRDHIYQFDLLRFELYP